MTRNNDLKKLQTIMDNTWGDDEEVVEALYNICNKDIELCIKIMKEDKTFNRYTCFINSWSDLAYEIINDDAFKSISYASYLEPIKEIKDDETQCHSYLYKHGWRIDEDLGVAFGFDIEDLRKEGYTIN